MKALLYVWNTLVVLAMVAAWRYGFVEATAAKDSTGVVTWLIVGVFALSQVAAWWRGTDYRRANILYDAETIMVMLGLAGTVIGFMDALVDIKSGNTEGISTALWTTLVGLIGSMVNFVTHRLMGGTKG